jgi:phage shock protein A
MGIFTRFSDIVNSNINAILDKAEDPEKIVRLMIQEMEDTLVEVRSAAARSIADKKDLNRKLESLESELQDWEEKAELALRKGREDLAKAALVEKSRVQSAADAVKADYAAVDEGLAKLNEDIARLEAKLQDAKTRQKVRGTRQPIADSLRARRSTTTRSMTLWFVSSSTRGASMT